MDDKDQEKIRILREMATSPGWREYKAHLDRQWMKKEREKAQALRQCDVELAKRRQAEADTLKFVVSELDSLIERLNSLGPEQNQE